MLFSSVTFLLLFLPIILVLYFGVFRPLGRTASNLFLFASSLFFYAWGEPYYIYLLLGSIFLNYGIAAGIEYKVRFRKIFLWFGIATNLCILFVFKYLNFVIENFQRAGWSIRVPHMIDNLVMPIGISFYTFQALSYVIDVYKGIVKAKRNPLDVGLYISFFPQLIAGPIVKYSTIAQQITERRESWNKVCEGLSRFVIGLSKKVILSNSFALIADEIFADFEWGGGNFSSMAGNHVLYTADIL